MHAQYKTETTKTGNDKNTALQNSSEWNHHLYTSSMHEHEHNRKKLQHNILK